MSFEWTLIIIGWVCNVLAWVNLLLGKAVWGYIIVALICFFWSIHLDPESEELESNPVVIELENVTAETDTVWVMYTDPNLQVVE